MKHWVIVLTVLMTAACHHTMDSWPSDGDRQEVAMFVRTRSLSGITAIPSAYQVIIFDSQNQTTQKYNVNPDQGHQLHVKLFPGSYSGYCTTHAETEEYWEFSENSIPANIFLKGQKTNNGTESVNDHLLGNCDFTVTKESGNTATFDLKRQVGMLRLDIQNIPKWLTDLQINVTDIPKKMSLLGGYSLESYTIQQAVSPPDESGNSITDLLVFPPKVKSVLTLTSSSQNFITPGHTIDVLQVNQITAIKAVFKNLSESAEIDFTTNLVNWDEDIYNENWDIDLPEGPCQGQGSGINLVANNSFENGFTGEVPTGWKLSSGGSDKRVVEVSAPTYEGSKALRLEGKTQLYQEIPIAGGQCYQLKMFVNAQAATAKWRYWITWLNGKKDLSIGALHPTGYQNLTSGYTDVLAGIVVRAPGNATTLRMEIRNYSTLIQGEGLYVDDVSVKTVN